MDDFINGWIDIHLHVLSILYFYPDFTPPISVASSSSADVHSFDEEAEVFLKDSM